MDNLEGRAEANRIAADLCANLRQSHGGFITPDGCAERAIVTAMLAFAQAEVLKERRRICELLRTNVKTGEIRAGKAIELIRSQVSQ